MSPRLPPHRLIYEMFVNSIWSEVANEGRPLFTELNYIGFRPAVLNQIDKDFSIYWEPYTDD